MAYGRISGKNFEFEFSNGYRVCGGKATGENVFVQISRNRDSLRQEFAVCFCIAFAVILLMILLKKIVWPF